MLKLVVMSKVREPKVLTFFPVELVFASYRPEMELSPKAVNHSQESPPVKAFGGDADKMLGKVQLFY